MESNQLATLQYPARKKGTAEPVIRGLAKFIRTAWIHNASTELFQMQLLKFSQHARIFLSTSLKVTRILSSLSNAAIHVSLLCKTIRLSLYDLMSQSFPEALSLIGQLVLKV
jgi:hypothetical protein